MRIKTILFFFIIVAAHSICSAQQDKTTDSLLNVLKTQKDDTGKVNTLNALSRGFSRKSEFELSNKYAKDAISLAEKLNFKKGFILAYTCLGINNWLLGNYKEAMENHLAVIKFGEETGNKSAIGIAYNNIGLLYSDQGNTTEAIKNYLIGAKISEESGDKKSQANAYYNVGNTYYSPLSNFTEAIKAHMISLRLSKEIDDKGNISNRYIDIGNSYESLGNYPEALKNYLAALKISEETGSKGNIASSYNNIGEIYKNEGNYAEAIKYYLAGLKVFEEIKSKYGVAISYDNIGEIYSFMGKYDDAMKNHLLALKIGEETNYKYGIAYSYLNIGNTYYLQSNYPEALKIFFSSLKLFKEIEENEGKAKIYIKIGQACFKLNKISEARQYFNDALSVAKEIQGKKIIKEAYENLAGLDSANKNWDNAFMNYKLAVLYRDSLVNETNTNKITEQRMQFEFTKKEDSLNYQQALTDEKLKQQTLLTRQQKQTKNYLIAGLALFAVLSFFVYRNYRTRQRLKLQTLRNKIASDLHDDVGSTLSSISIFSEMAKQQSKEVIPMLDTIGESSRKMLDAMADIVWTINPANDQFEKIILRMRSFAYELLGAKKIDFEFVADDDVAKMKLPMDIRKNLYLIFKEATNNLVKYSGANRAFFAVKKEANNLTMLIRDNGKGFDMAQAKEGNGLINMKKRAEEIGAQFMIDSHPGEGTTIQLKVAV